MRFGYEKGTKAKINFHHTSLSSKVLTA